MPRSSLSLLIAGAVLLCAAGCRAPSPSVRSLNNVSIVTSDPGNPVVPPLAFHQLQPGFRKVVRRTDHKVFSIGDGLPDVRAASNSPIVAATEQDGWFFYATSATSGEVDKPDSAVARTTQHPQFIAGYAIKRGTREIYYWSVW